MGLVGAGIKRNENHVSGWNPIRAIAAMMLLKFSQR
jgi:hypothetical protein